MLLKDWNTSREQLKILQEELSQVPSWRWVHKSKVRNAVHTETNRGRSIEQRLLQATKSWLRFIGLPPKAALTLLSASRSDMSGTAPEYYAHLQENSVGMVQIPSSRTGEFFVAKLLTTQGLFTEVMGFNPSKHQGVLNPVDSVSWWDAVIFCNRLSLQLGYEPAYHITESQISEVEGADGFRLPRWSDWKLAARGQQAHRFSGASDAHLVGWVDKSATGTQRVATKEPNAWGIYDMTGNVAEWCWDEGDDPSTMEKRLIAGGSFRDGLEWVRTDAHNFEDPRFSSHDLGFRIGRRLVIRL
jgi:formylglycine-generating enzyme required for sulfatase activity